jgi:hypothetical protein
VAARPRNRNKKVLAMKRIFTILLLSASLFQGFSQEVSAENERPQKKVAETNENARVAIGQDLLVIEESRDATSIRVGDHGITIPKDDAAREDEEEKDSPAKKRSKFKGHWAGLELGLNNYSTSDYSLSLPAEINYMQLHSGKSRNLNLNFGQLSIGLARHVGFVTGLGVSWNNYMFDGDNNIIKGAGGVIEVLNPGEVLKKSKLSTLYLRLPFLFEVQIPTDRHRLNVSAGPVGAVKLMSNSVMVFEDDHKVKSDGDFNLNLLRYGATARIGYENFNIYGTYFFSPLFKTGYGPGGYDLFPFEIGIAFTIDD